MSTINVSLDMVSNIFMFNKWFFLAIFTDFNRFWFNYTVIIGMIALFVE